MKGKLFSALSLRSLFKLSSRRRVLFTSCVPAAFFLSALLCSVCCVASVHGQTPTPTPCVPSYAFSSTTGASIVPGTTDTGNHIDDGVVLISLPFTWSLYGTSYSTVSVDSNGTLQFGSSETAFSNSCLPSNTFDQTIFPHWDDLRTDDNPGCSTYPGSLCGIYTSTTGSAPNRIFNIEWRTVYFSSNTSRANFEVRLFEGQNTFEMIYGEIAGGGASATVGVQRGTGTSFTQYECNTGGLSNGLKLTATGTACGTPTPQPSPSPSGSPCGSPVMLYDQMNNSASNSTSSQDFEASSNAFDDQAADDFVVPSGQTWNVTQVNVAGVYFNGPGPASLVNIFFYPNAGSLPGTTATCTYNQIPITSGGATGAFNVVLPSPCALASGTYWVSVQARMDFTPNGQWGWTDRNVQSNSAAAWRNPGGGFASPCNNWGARGATCLIDPPAPDQMFQIMGRSCGAARTAFDFDGDHLTDISVWRASVGQWWLNRSMLGPLGLSFGSPTDVPRAADYTGDGKTDIAFFRPSTNEWFILRSEDFTYYAFPFGSVGDISVTGDYDGDGMADAGVYRPTAQTWFIARSSGGVLTVPFGLNGDIPVPADYDGDGKTDVAIYRPNVGQWWILRSGNGSVVAASFGNASDKPVPGDYTGDGKADIAFFRPSDGNWYIIRSEDFTFYAFPWGNGTDKVAPGDYDGDGRFDAAVYRQSDTVWYILKSSGGTSAIQFGISSDVPVPGQSVP